MIRPLSISILVGLSSSVSWAVEPKPCPVAPLQESKITADGLTKYLAIFNKKSTSIEDFVCCLPEQFRQSIAVAHSGVAAQNSRPESPRVIMSNFVSGKPPTKFLSINGGHPDLNQSNSVEMVLVDDKTGEVTLHDIAFTKDGAKVSEPNPPLCLKCHGNPPHLIFEGPTQWPRFVNGMTTEIQAPQEFAGGVSQSMVEKYFTSKETVAKKALKENPRYRCLTKDVPGVNFLIELDDAIEEQNEKRIAEQVRKSKDFDRFKLAMFGQQECPSAREDLDCQLGGGNACRSWLAPEAIRELTQVATLRESVAHALNNEELFKAIREEKARPNASFATEMAKPLKAEGRLRSVSEKLTVGNMRGHANEAEELLKKYQSLIMRKYLADQYLSGSAIPGGLRLLFEARGISMSDWGTDIVAGYERLRVSGPALMRHEADPDLRGKLTKLFLAAGEEKKLLCEDLRKRSLVASRAAASRPSAVQSQPTKK